MKHGTKLFQTLMFLCCLLSSALQSIAQKTKASNLVHVDKKGVLRYTKTKGEASFFGVNYTVPFAYGYRSHKALGVDLEKAIDADVYHFARLGLDAFRVHVWDTEISDSLGNLKENEHLRLFDYLLFKLKERGIKILITPLAFWGPGYPEPDVKTGSFSSIWNKQKVLVTEEALTAQETYLKQFLAHQNPYTNKTYGADEDVIALEINNEPHHSGSKQGAADYIARMVAAVRSSGWTKPIFYNISESPTYAAAVANSAVDGVSFQWYPTGLVAGHEWQGNVLPNVDAYRIPFDTIAAYKNKSRMVYEFDAGDVLQSNMYPAMARSFRTAGFQWATQFAYDPMATAYANTEYQTHFLNLAYTPSKAISLLIASKAFHQVPRLKSYGAYPTDSVFEAFRVSYKNKLSEWNSDTAFYYSNTTNTQPTNSAKLVHIAGVGSSTLITYAGSGAYFLDKLSDGSWRLEVMPDAVSLRDPFEKASPKKEVTRMEWNENSMTILLPDLSQNFSITPLNSGNTFSTRAQNGTFNIRPGTYRLGGHGVLKKLGLGAIGLTEFAAPPHKRGPIYLRYDAPETITAAQPFQLETTIVGLDTTATVQAELHNNAIWKTVSLQRISANQFAATVPAELLQTGVLNTRFFVRSSDSIITFPSGATGNPYAWDAIATETYKTDVLPNSSPLLLFNAATDRDALAIYNQNWQSATINLIPVGALARVLSFGVTPVNGLQTWAFEKDVYAKNTLYQFSLADNVILAARSGKATSVKVTLVTTAGAAFSQTVLLSPELKNNVLPLQAFKQDSALLLPRPYPGFQPLYFKSSSSTPLQVTELDKIQVSFATDKPTTIDVQAIWLEQK